MPIDRTTSISSAMLCTPNLRITFSRCLRTVSGLIFSWRAISLLVRPSTTKCTTWVSRGRSRSDTGGKQGGPRRRASRELDRMRYQLSGCEEGQFPHDARAMLANREFGNAERFCDALAAQSSADLQQNFRFPIGETRHVPLLGGAISPEIEATASLPERSSTAGLPANRRA